MNDQEFTKDKTEVLLRLAESKFDKKDYKSAIKMYNKIIDNDPNDSWSYWERGLVKKANKDYKGALQDFNKTIDLDASNSFAFYQRALLKEKFGDNKGADADFIKVNALRDKKDIELDLNKTDKNENIHYSKEKDGRPGL